MATASNVLSIAQKEIGYSRWTDPANGTKYGRWYAQKTGSSYFGQNGVPYCAMFVSWVLDQAGQSCSGFPTASCSSGKSGASKAGLIRSNKKSAQPGDLVIFDWGSDGNVDHIGIVELNKGSYIQTIEGNTSSGTSGSQSNGGGVYRRTRDWSTVNCVIAVPYNGSTASAPATSNGGLEVDGFWGKATTLKLQQVLGAPYKDGQISRQNDDWKSRCKGCTGGWEWLSSGYNSGSQTIKLIQAKVGVTQDGLIGPNTINGIIGYFMKYGSGATELDGKLDGPSLTIKAMQKRLNSGTF